MELSNNPTRAIIHSKTKVFLIFRWLHFGMPRAFSIPTCTHYYMCILLFIRIFGLFSVKTDFRVCVPLKLPPSAAGTHTLQQPFHK